MKITLRSKADMWFIPGKVHLTFESKTGELDVETLTNSEVRMLAFAVSGGTVHVDDLEALNRKLASIVPVAVNKPAVLAVNPKKKVSDALEAKRAELLTAAEGALKQELSAIKKIIEGTTDISFLKALVEAETSGKKRKNVLTSAAAKLTLLSEQLSKTLGPEVVFTNPDNDNLVIEEELGEQISVNTLIPKDFV